MKLYSLRWATFRALVIPMLVALVLVAGAGVWTAHRSISTLRDHEMQQEGAFLMMLSLHEATEGERLGMIPSSDSDQLRKLRGSGTGFRIWSDSVIVTAAGALPAADLQAPQPGFQTIRAAGKEWRRYAVRHADLPIVIEVVEPGELRDELAWQMAISMTEPILLLILAVSVIATFQIASAMRPMLQLSREINARDTDDLRPLGGTSIPAEIAPLVAAVNDLMSRLGRAIEHEREFTDNAAHELRTPLAVLKTRAQIAERALADSPARQEELKMLVAAIDRATGVIEQLLVLSRLQGGHATFGTIDFSQLTEDVARDLVPMAIAKQQEVDASIAPGVMVQGNADSLSMVIRNLIDNAIRYAPVKGEIAIGLIQGTDGTAILRVSDNGPGIPPDKIERVFERFTRYSHDESGSGLGLAIVERILQQHKGSIVLQNAQPHGLICEVRLG